MNVNATAVNKTKRGLLLTRRTKRRGSARKKIVPTARFATIRRISLKMIAAYMSIFIDYHRDIESLHDRRSLSTDEYFSYSVYSY